MIPFSRTAAGSYTGGFTDVEKEIVADLAAQIAGMLGGLVGSGDPLFAAVGIGGTERLNDDPAIARLLPDAYGDDAGASADFRRLTEQSLANRKVANARTVIDSLTAPGDELELDEAQAQAWLRTLSDIRLTIAARLGIEHDGDSGETEGDAALALHELYHWLAYVTESLLDALDDDE